MQAVRARASVCEGTNAFFKRDVLHSSLSRSKEVEKEGRRVAAPGEPF